VRATTASFADVCQPTATLFADISTVKRKTPHRRCKFQESPPKRAWGTAGGYVFLWVAVVLSSSSRLLKAMETEEILRPLLVCFVSGTAGGGAFVGESLPLVSTQLEGLIATPFSIVLYKNQRSTYELKLTSNSKLTPEDTRCPAAENHSNKLPTIV
jgi:hypothetical protein